MCEYIVRISVNVRDPEAATKRGRKKPGVGFAVPPLQFGQMNQVALFFQDALHRYSPALGKTFGQILRAHGEVLEAGAAHANKSARAAGTFAKTMQSELDAFLADCSRQSKAKSNGQASTATSASSSRAVRRA